MKDKVVKGTWSYDGSQLRPLYNYLEQGLLGDSIVMAIGPCQVDFAHMIDGEDLLERAQIAGSRMLHFLVEIFDRDLFGGVALQRLMAALAQQQLNQHLETQPRGGQIKRRGDDLYWNEKKLSISIATRSANSVLMHFAMNLSNQGTPVPTCALEDDFALDGEKFGRNLMQEFISEYESMLEATRKVRPL